MSNISIQMVSTDDYSSLANFLSSFEANERDSEKWFERILFWWDNNPAYIKGHPRGVVLKDNETIVGFTGNFPTRMLWDGKEKIAANGTTWRVLPEYRKHSMDVWFKHREALDGYLYFNATANPLVAKILKILKFDSYNCAELGSYYFISNPAEMNFKALKNKVIGLYFLMCKSYHFLDNLIHYDKDISIRKMTFFGEEADFLWEKTKHKFLFTNIRDKKYLDWVSKDKDIYYIYLESELIGFFIIHLREDKAILVDIWGDLSTVHYTHIVKSILKNYKNYNILVPAYNYEMFKIVRKYGLIKKKEKFIGFLQSQIQITDTNKVYLTMLQGDYGV